MGSLQDLLKFHKPTAYRIMSLKKQKRNNTYKAMID